MTRRRLAAGEPFFFDATKIRIGLGRSLPLRNQQAKPFSPASIRKSGLEIKNRCTHEGINRQNPASIRKFGLEIKNRCTHEGINRQNPASILKSGPEIKNRCTMEGVSRQNPAVILKFTPSNQESLHAGGRFQAKTCSDSQVHPIKSRITARRRTFSGKNMQ